MSSIDEIMKKMNKESGSTVVKYGVADFSGFKRIPFTSPRLNYMTYGGLPVGKLIEFFGEEHGGKTTTALDVVANYQQMEDARKVLYVDAENTLDIDWARKIGVDTDDENFITFNPTQHSAEAIFQFVLDMMETDEIGLVVIDSIGVMVSSQAMEKSVEEKTYAGISMALTNFSEKAVQMGQKTKCTTICINQLRDDLNSQWGGVKTPGGRAYKHNCTVRMRFSRGSFIDERGDELKRSSESPAGNIVLVSMEKNKSCPPNRRTGFYTINYEYGVDYLKDLVELAIKYGVIEKAGAWFSIINPDTGEQIVKLQGQANVNAYLEDEDNEETLTLIENYVDSKINMPA